MVSASAQRVEIHAKNPKILKWLQRLKIFPPADLNSVKLRDKNIYR